MNLEDIKKELLKIIDFLKCNDTITTDLDKFNLFIMKFLDDSLEIEGYEVNSNILSFFIYLSSPLFYFDINILDDNGKNKIQMLQKQMFKIFNETIYNLIFTDNPFDKFYTERGLALSKYVTESIAIYGKASLTLEARFTNTLLKQIILYSILGSFKLSSEDGYKILDWLSEYYFNLGESKSYIVI